MKPIPAFEGFPAISRLRKPCIITEKIDGTNAQILVTADGDVFAGSRNRWLTLEDDNFGFARWVKEHEADLLALGEGRHFGEWWGSGIQRRYGLSEKRFSLFNTARWGESRPDCCRVVPVLFEGEFSTIAVDAALGGLRAYGSAAAPGFANPEGVVVYHAASKQLFKQTFDDSHKGGAK